MIDNSNNQIVAPKARTIIHEVIVNWLSNQPRGTILDAPAGYGHLSMKLDELGFQVTCGEIEPEIFRLKNIKCIFTDLNKNINMPDKSFDYVCCVDGLEHMTDPSGQLKNFPGF